MKTIGFIILVVVGAVSIWLGCLASSSSPLEPIDMGHYARQGHWQSYDLSCGADINDYAMTRLEYLKSFDVGPEKIVFNHELQHPDALRDSHTGLFVYATGGDASITFQLKKTLDKEHHELVMTVNSSYCSDSWTAQLDK